jgi:hypothetical protein
MCVSGVVFIVGGVLAGLLKLAEMQVSEGRPAALWPLSGVLFSVLAGLAIMRLPQQMEQEREKRLKEYHAAAPAGAAPPVELPPPPSAEFLSVIFGALALTSPLFSLLLMVFLFGPAAVVCGVIALAQGHLKGLVGMVLGIVGMIVWGMLFF